MHNEHVFGDQRPFAQCHASTLLELEDGGILVAWFGGTRESHSDTAIWIAERPAPAERPAETGEPPGAAWTAPRIAARVEGPFSDSDRGAEDSRPHWNPVLFSPSRGTIALHFKVGSRIRDWQTWSQLSSDGGRSWNPPSPLVPGDRGGRGAVKNKPIPLRSGAWLAGASLEGWRRWDAFVDRSPNGIDGWQRTETIRIDRKIHPGKGIIQPTLWQAGDGTVHALFRSAAGRIFASQSTDDGRTWSDATPTGLPNNNSGIDVVRLGSGVLALACNPVGENWGARTPLCVLFSRDEGRRWPARIDIETGPGEYSYPSIIEFGDGICVSYTWNRRRIAVFWIGREEVPNF